MTDGPTSPQPATIRLVVADAPDPVAAAAVERGLLDFNRAVIGDPHEATVQVFLRDADDAIAGGLLGQVRWRWLYVAKLWVADRARGGGWGKALMDAAEARARELHCIGVRLDTFEFQARAFYERLGYVLYGTLEGYPPGYRHFNLAKRLDGAESDA